MSFPYHHPQQQVQVQASEWLGELSIRKLQARSATSSDTLRRTVLIYNSLTRSTASLPSPPPTPDSNSVQVHVQEVDDADMQDAAALEQSWFDDLMNDLESSSDPIVVDDDDDVEGVEEVVAAAPLFVAQTQLHCTPLPPPPPPRPTSPAPAASSSSSVEEYYASPESPPTSPPGLDQDTIESDEDDDYEDDDEDHHHHHRRVLFGPPNNYFSHLPFHDYPLVRPPPQGATIIHH